MDEEDKSGMNRLRWTDEYISGVNNFFDKAFERAAHGKEILCPCKKCMNHYWHYRNVVEDHLVVNGFVAGYTKWIFYGEGFRSRCTPQPINDDEGNVQTNTENRKNSRHLHTVGLSSSAIIREEKMKESSAAPTNKDIFVATRKRKPGRVYKDSYEDTTRKIAKIERTETQENEDVSQSVDAFSSVMGPAHPGCVQLYGRGVTKTVLKGKMVNSGPSLNNDEMIQQKLKEIEERVLQKMQEKFDTLKDTMIQDITMSIVAQLQLLNPKIQIDPNMLRFNGCSSQEAANQLINCPSFGSNNQGVENEEREDESSEDLT